MNDSIGSARGKQFFDVVESMAGALAGMRVGAAGVGGSSAPRPAVAVPRLESVGSNVNSDPLPVRFAALVPCTCRSRTCEKCGPRLGWLVRQNALSKSHLFRRPAMLTLTVDRSGFAKPETAHAAITKGKFIPRLLRLLGVKSWLWVLEFQTATGDGWPHWHVLIDLSDVPGRRIDLGRAWRLWRDRWHLGGLDLSVKSSFADPAHAVLYVTKYLTKMPEAFPVWVLVRGKVIRFVGGCKRLGSLTGQPARQLVEAEAKDQLDLPFREPRAPLIERMARCQMSCQVFCVEGDCRTGEGDWCWIGSAKAVPEDLIDLAEGGMISVRLAAVDFGEREYLAITGASVGGLLPAVKRLDEELADRDVGYRQEWEDRIDRRLWEMLERHATFWAHRTVLN